MVNRLNYTAGFPPSSFETRDGRAVPKGAESHALPALPPSALLVTQFYWFGLQGDNFRRSPTTRNVSDVHAHDRKIIIMFLVGRCEVPRYAECSAAVCVRVVCVSS